MTPPGGSSTTGAGAEVIAFDPARRRANGPRDGRDRAGDRAERRRCGAPTAAGRPCRNWAGPSGACRLHTASATGVEGAEPSAAGAGREPDARTGAGRAPSATGTGRAPGARQPDAADRGSGPGGAAQPGSGQAEGARSAASGGGLLGAVASLAEDGEIQDAVASALRFLRRRLTGDYEIDLFGFDRELTEQVILPLARPLYQRYWRIRTTGLENVPDTGGALVVANHGGTLPFDAIMTKVALADEHPARRHLRELAADLALGLPVIGPLARKTGNTLAHDDDARRLLDAGELVGVWPEGYKGVGKLYRDRYKLQRFGRGGFVEIALRAQVPIIPVAIVGAEEIYPMVANVRILARLLGLPYFPITWQFPLLGPLGIIPLPSRWVIDFGAPIDTSRYGPEAADDPMLVFELTDLVRDTIQQMLYRNLMGRRSVFF